MTALLTATNEEGGMKRIARCVERPGTGTWPTYLGRKAWYRPAGQPVLLLTLFVLLKDWLHVDQDSLQNTR
jgi:hypothetical protein